MSLREFIVGWGLIVGMVVYACLLGVRSLLVTVRDRVLAGGHPPGYETVGE